MEATETSLPIKIIKSQKLKVGFYALLTCFFMAMALLVFSTINAGIAPGLVLVVVVALGATHIGIIVGLTFDSCRRYSRFGISHTKNTLNHVLNVALIALPLLSFLMPILIVPALILFAVSKYMSPDDASEKEKPFHKRDGFFDLVNAVLWFMTAAVLFTFGHLPITFWELVNAVLLFMYFAVLPSDTYL